MLLATYSSGRDLAEDGAQMMAKLKTDVMQTRVNSLKMYQGDLQQRGQLDMLD